MTRSHPILALDEVTPSAEQRPAVLSRGSDVVVTAGAGAGKTRALVGRYLSLLVDGYPLRSIVAITFTRKAAREMRSRIRQAVRAYQAHNGLDADERRRWQEIYLALDSARIDTIHSLCAEILRMHPAEASIDPAFAVLDEGQAGLFQQQALYAGLGLAASRDDLVNLFTVYGERNLQQTLSGLLKQRLEAAYSFSQESANIEADWRERIQEHRDIALSRLYILPAWQHAVAILYAEEASDPTDRAEMQRRSTVEALAAFDRVKDPDLLQAISTINLSGGRVQAWPGGAAQRDEVKAALRSLRDLWKDHEKAILRSFNVLDAALAETRPKLMQVFHASLAHYTMLKERHNVLDFDDLEITALNLVNTYPMVRERWRREVRALLVDEFQDTNARQRDLLDQLNGNEQKLFIVGDGKQSIYGFRGADVAVFRDKKAHIQQSGQFYALTESYRAHRELIDVLNACLKPVLGEHEVAGAPWIEPFAPLTHVRDEPRGCESPYVEFHLTVGSKVDGAMRYAADILASRLRAIVENSGGDLTYDDVAVLCRASTSFRDYEDAFDRAGIPYNTVSGRGFYDRPEIRDVLNALKALADPTDDCALAGFLRSPACGLSDMALYKLTSCARENAEDSLWAFMCHTDFSFLANGNLPDDVSRAEKACSLIQSLHQVVGRITVSDLLKQLLDITDTLAALMRTGSSRSVHNITKLLSDAHDSGIVGISEFLTYVTGLKDSGGREGEASILSEGAVRIMTVHAAKGLEFGIVAIGDAGRGEVNRNGLLIDDIFGVLPFLSNREVGSRDILVPAVYEIAKELDKAKSLAESDRMLYVAATRAKEKLLLSGTARINKQGTLSLNGWLERLAGEHGLNLAGAHIVYNAEGDAVHDSSLSVSTDAGEIYPVGCYIYEPYYIVPMRKPPSAPVGVQRTKPPYPLLAPLAPESVVVDEDTINVEREPPRSVWRVVPADKSPRVPGWVVGSLVHNALARWFFPDDAGFYDWTEALARGYGVTDAAALRYAVRNATSILHRFQSSNLYDQMLSAELRLCEVPYTIMDGAGHVEVGTIDVLYKLGDQWHLVEYKTDYVHNGDALRALLLSKDYVEQMGTYLDAVERLLGERPQPNLCFLNVDGSIVSITDRW